jgi:hypothetical protein
MVAREKTRLDTYRKSRLKAHGFNRGMKGRCPASPFGDGKNNQFTV